MDAATRLNPAASASPEIPEYVRHQRLRQWVMEVANLTRPQRIVWCDGSEQEYRRLCGELVGSGTLVPLDATSAPAASWPAPIPRDVARVEDRTFICSIRKADAGPTNNWVDPREMKARLRQLFEGSMRGRTMYVVPFAMGPIGSPISHIGVEITDSAYVAVSMRIMTRMGRAAVDALGDDGTFVPCLHSVGMPLAPGQHDVAWPCNREHKYIVHFPEEQCDLVVRQRLRRQRAARQEVLRAAHRLGHGPGAGLAGRAHADPGRGVAERREDLCRCRLPQRLRQDQLRDADPARRLRRMEGHDGGRRHRLDQARTGRRASTRSIPEFGFFGVAPGTSRKSNPNAMATLERNCIFTNVAMTEDGDVWWEDMTEQPPARLIDWQGQPWTAGCGRKAAHPNARFTVPAAQCPSIDDRWEHPAGVPISAFIFGGRRSQGVPLVYETFNWADGVYAAATMGSETTAAAAGKTGEVRRDPFAMLPFCGYHIGDYFDHWLKLGRHVTNPPRIFCVNWFRKGADGKFLWPGYGENMRVLKWIVERCHGRAQRRRERAGLDAAPRAIWNGRAWTRCRTRSSRS